MAPLLLSLLSIAFASKDSSFLLHQPSPLALTVSAVGGESQHRTRRRLSSLMMTGSTSMPVASDVEDLSGSGVEAPVPAKTLYLIRHGTSLSNEFMQQPGSEWGAASFRDDVRLRDARLSPKGQRECAALAEHLARQPWLDQVDLVVVSPLTRCLETTARGVAPAFAASPSCDHNGMPPVIVLPWIAERVYTAGDVGTPPSSLRLEWPMFDWSLVPEEWWYKGDGAEEPEWRPHGQGQWYAVPGEPMRAFHDRMAMADAWLHQRPERNILVVTHWAVIRHYTSREVANCEVAVIEKWAPASGSESQSSA